MITGGNVTSTSSTTSSDLIGRWGVRGEETEAVGGFSDYGFMMVVVVVEEESGDNGYKESG